MKKNLFVVLILLLFHASVKGQGNLQFNQALLLESSLSTCTICWTVPTGKVWKVEQIMSSSDGLPSLYINNKELVTMTGTAYATSSTSYWGHRWGYNTPFWLPANSTMGFGSLGSPKNITFFVLEFNLVP
jgi:hypothetical protein